MLFLFVSALAILVLIACWFTGEQSPITKVVFTLLWPPYGAEQNPGPEVCGSPPFDRQQVQMSRTA